LFVFSSCGLAGKLSFIPAFCRTESSFKNELTNPRARTQANLDGTMIHHFKSYTALEAGVDGGNRHVNNKSEARQRALALNTCGQTRFRF